jgi:predicted phage tail protein
MSQSYTFAPVIAGSKNAGIMMVLGVALIAMTGGFAAFGVAGLGGGSATAAATVGTVATAETMAMGIATAVGETITLSAAAGATGASMTGILAFQGASYLGMGLLLGGASMMLAPDTPDGNNASKAENYLFSGPINTVKQGEAIPLVYGRIITGSKTVMGSLFTTSSNNESQTSKTRKLVGIGGFRNDGDKHGLNSTTGRYTGGYYGYGGRHGGQEGGEGYH